MTFPQKIRALMRIYKQNAIARRVGISPQSLNAYLHHGAIPSADVAVRLADALGVDVSWLIDDRQNWPPVTSKFPMEPPAPDEVTEAVAA
jgi:transcriptional regulator with XRE-family HTH domain